MNGLFPTPQSIKETEKSRNEFFYYLGLFVSKSLLDERLIDIKFSNQFFKLVFGEVLDFKDLKFINRSIYKQFKKLYKICEEKKGKSIFNKEIENNLKLSENEKLELINGLKFDEVNISDLFLSFICPTTEDCELIENGAEKNVDIFNLEEYLNLSVKYLLKDGVTNQITKFKLGNLSIK
jgi:E3 ubiquitin-protein ligase TRIP12